MMIPYESTGRTRQKRRTRAALVEGARSLLAAGQTPGVERAADVAGVSRTTAYRYFPSQRDLLLAAIPTLDRRTQLGDDAPLDVAERLDLVVREQLGVIEQWEPQLRAALRLSLNPAGGPGDTPPPLREGRAIGWIQDALSPLTATHPHVDVRRLAIAIRAGCGIESWVWLVDVAGLSREAAGEVMRESAQALLAAARRGAGRNAAGQMDTEA